MLARLDTPSPPSGAMDARYRSAASARSAWWRPMADALGIQPPLVTLRRGSAGGGKLVTWFADGDDAVAVLTRALRLPAPAAGARLDTLLPTVALAVAAMYAVSGGGAAPSAEVAAAATQPTVALYDGMPAMMVEWWPTPDAMLATVVPTIDGASHGPAAAAASTSATAPPPAPLRPSTAAAVASAAAAPVAAVVPPHPVAAGNDKARTWG
eukprot:TRINITY_DN5092_c0_g1_i1.p2 TRINITY_DN5092_c0_g1~~TRINITY_DN5092_c0_g1_i1.p2  ORF type:complete len:211 (-),score=40.51 TRINITY_DN5092_c0_g1_i1:353-985(-)